MPIYIYITIYLPHSPYMFRYAMRHLQGRLLLFLLNILYALYIL